MYRGAAAAAAAAAAQITKLIQILRLASCSMYDSKFNLGVSLPFVICCSKCLQVHPQS